MHFYYFLNGLSSLSACHFYLKTESTKIGLCAVLSWESGVDGDQHCEDGDKQRG